MINVAIAQRNSDGTADENFKGMAKMIEHAVENSKNLDVIVFPEYCYRAPETIKDTSEAEEVPGKFTEAIKELARKFKINIIPGSFVEKAEGGKVYNTCVFINRKGEIIGKYQKIHLFDAIGFKESDYVEAGKDMCVIDTDIGRVGIMVCYDLRFPELARSMVLQGADILFVPSAFPSGKLLPPRTDHWDVLVQSTAMLNLTYVVAVNQYGHIGTENHFGRSSIVDPWGTVVSSASNREDIAFATLDMDYQNSIRESVATWRNRKPEIYKL